MDDLTLHTTQAGKCGRTQTVLVKELEIGALQEVIMLVGGRVHETPGATRLPVSIVLVHIGSELGKFLPLKTFHSHRFVPT